VAGGVGPSSPFVASGEGSSLPFISGGVGPRSPLVHGGVGPSLPFVPGGVGPLLSFGLGPSFAVRGAGGLLYCSWVVVCPCLAISGWWWWWCTLVGFCAPCGPVAIRG